MDALIPIQDAAHRRAAQTIAAHPDWPCRKGCDDCCRSLASTPLVTRPEWDRIAAALESLPPEIADAARLRILDSAHSARPVICPLLDTATGACLIYDARPVACRAYGFYAERDRVLGCHRIESIANANPAIIWGNHETLESRLQALAPTAPLDEWQRATPEPRSAET